MRKMSGIFLRCEDGVADFAVPPGDTVIGRGPFLQVTDKRVSRNHGVLQCKSGRLYITSTHTNPCFYKKKGSTVPEIIHKDQEKALEDGDRFGLLPDQLYFEVKYKGAVNGEIKGDIKEESSSQPSGKKKKLTPRKNLDSDEEELERKPAASRKKADLVKVPGRKKEMVMPLDKKRTLPVWMIQVAASAPLTPKKPKTTVKRKPAASPAPKKEREPLSDSEEEEPSPKPRAKVKKPQKRYMSDDEEEPAPQKRGRKPKAQKTSDSDDDGDSDYEAPLKPSPSKRGRKPVPKKQYSSDEEESEEEEKKKKKSKSRRRKADSDDDDAASRPARAAARKRGSYVDDFVVPSELLDDDSDSETGGKKDEDSDFVMDFEEESGSDWEASKSSSQKAKGKRGSKRTPGRKRKRGRGSDDDSDEGYVPRLSKRRSSTAKKSYKEVDEDDDSDSSSGFVSPKKTKKGRGRPPAKKTKDSDEDEGSDDFLGLVPNKKTQKRGRTPAKKGTFKAQPPVKKPKDDDDESPKKTFKHRPPCMFGKKCYRKNPAHRLEYSHVGDASFDEASEEDEEKEDCPFGPSCYKTNLGHRQKYRHTVSTNPDPPKRKPRADGKKSVHDKEDDDDGLPNTYDYQDSFLDDGGLSESEESLVEPGDEDSDYEPEGSQDVRDLVKDAKGFMKNKKLVKPVKTK